MVKVYSIALVVGIIGLLILLIGGALKARSGDDSAETPGTSFKMGVGALLAFGMAGLSAEFAPIDFTWPLALAMALVAAALGAGWVRYAVGVAAR